MTRVEEFDTFYDSTRQYVLHQVYALSGELNLATASVKDAYAHAWQNWSKLRSRDPLSYVRSEAWRQTVLQRGTHLLRRKQDDPGDHELLDALHELPGNARRLLVLQTIGELDAGDAAREVGLTEETATSATQIARSALERKLGADITTVETRLHNLRTVTDDVAFERPSLARRRARKRGRRNTVGVIAASILAVAGAGVVVTQGGPLDNVADAAPQLRADTPPVDELPMSDDDMLEGSQLGKLGDAKKWKTDDTGTDIAARDTLSTCADERFADRRAAAGWVRTFETAKASDEQAIQTIEVSRDENKAARGFKRTVGWYADCAVPRLQLTDSYSVQHDGRETVVLKMRRWESPVRTYTVGISRAGDVTSTFVHETKGKNGPGTDAFARIVDKSLDPLCDEDDRKCERPGKVRETLPPETSTATGFLGVIDLPPVARVNELWVGTDPGKTDDNPAATQCDKADFSGKKVKGVRARTFVIPEKAGDLREAFGISQTIGSFAGGKAATKFVTDFKKRVDGCEDKNLSATVKKSNEIKGPKYTGKTWHLTFEVDDKHKVSYRMGIVRAGNLVTQVTFAPDRKVDIPSEDFNALVERAGERLRTRGPDAVASASVADR